MGWLFIGIVGFAAAAVVVLGGLMMIAKFYRKVEQGKALIVNKMRREPEVTFTGMTVLVNLIALPFYLLLIFLPPFNLFVFYRLNGYLLGREYFELVAVRRVESAAVRDLRKRNRGRVFTAGVIIAFFLTLPLINLVVPIVATAFMLHVFQGIQQRSGGSVAAKT